MYRAVVSLAFSTGGALPTPHKYWSGRGVAVNRSPKKAVRLARQMAIKRAGKGASQIPIFEDVEINSY